MKDDLDDVQQEFINGILKLKLKTEEWFNNLTTVVQDLFVRHSFVAITQGDPTYLSTSRLQVIYRPITAMEFFSLSYQTLSSATCRKISRVTLTRSYSEEIE